jgi:pantetheine-phosphate adenylyltransferase
VAIALFPGSFDPLTNGHADVIARSARLFDQLIVAVLVNREKQSLFTVDERIGVIAHVIRGLPDPARVSVEAFDGLLVDVVRRTRASAVVRGLRTATEFSDEWQMALMNRHLEPACETVFMLPSAECTYISSRLVKDIAAHGGPLEGLVPAPVAALFASKGARSK